MRLGGRRLYEDDLEAVVLPAPGELDAKAVRSAWEQFSAAATAERAAIATIEDELDRLTGESQLSA